MRNLKLFMYLLIFVGTTLLFSGLYFSVSSVDTSIRTTKKQVEINTAMLEEQRKQDSLNWVYINDKTKEHFDESDSLHKEIYELLTYCKNKNNK